MSTGADRGLAIKSDINKEGWEKADFPLVCETCLGDNPYLRMTKEPFGKACKICDRPFTIFRWKPGAQARFKKTELCQTCAKMKNVCQVCVLDLTYGLPVQVRDTLLGDQSSTALTVPQSDTNKQWFAGQHDRQVAEGHADSYGKAQLNEKLLRLARQQPYYKRNLPHKCSFYAKGECTRGDRCPFLHEMPTSREDPLAQQNIKDRFYGQEDPVAAKILNRSASLPELKPPDDPTITSLWLGGVDDSINEQDLRDVFYSFGEIASVRLVRKQQIAFVEYTSRPAAEAAAKALHNKLNVKGFRLRLTWAFRPAGPPPGATGGGGPNQANDSGASVLGQPPPVLNPGLLGGNLPPPPPGIMNFVPRPPPPQGWGMPPLPGQMGHPPPGGPPGGPPRGPPRGPPPHMQPRGPPRPYYPSQDPGMMGARR